VILIFAIAFCFFLFFQLQIPDFLGRDAYYHLKMAKFISEGKIISLDFPWLYFTTLREGFADQHFLFHLLLAPFLVFGDFLGAKIATSLFSSLAILIFYFILRKNKVFGATIWTILLLGSSSGFIFRMNLVQAQGLAMIWLFLGFLVLTQKKYFWLIPISFLYSWTHGGFVLILAMVLVWILFENWKLKIKNLKLRPEWPSLFMIFRPLWFVLVGIIFGVLFHPYFPELLPFLKLQLFQTGPLAKIPVGAEWYPYKSTANLLLSSGLIFLFFVASVFVLLVSKISKQKFIEDKNRQMPILVSFVFSVLFLVLTLRSQRFIEYLAPFVLLFAALVFSLILGGFFVRFSYQKNLKKFLAAGLIFIVLFFSGFSVFMTKKSFVGSYYQEYQGIAIWLKNNTFKNSIIANLDWSDFPPLFYFNDHNYYLAGLDPIFFYQYDKNLYQKLEDFLAGKNFKETSRIIKNDLRANYLVINNKFKNLEEKIKESRNFELVYGNEYLRVYKTTLP
jgi:hypothetical protein